MQIHEFPMEPPAAPEPDDRVLSVEEAEAMLRDADEALEAANQGAVLSSLFGATDPALRDAWHPSQGQWQALNQQYGPGVNGPSGVHLPGVPPWASPAPEAVDPEPPGGIFSTREVSDSTLGSGLTEDASPTAGLGPYYDVEPRGGRGRSTSDAVALEALLRMVTEAYEIMTRRVLYQGGPPLSDQEKSWCQRTEGVLAHVAAAGRTP